MMKNFIFIAFCVLTLSGDGWPNEQQLISPQRNHHAWLEECLNDISRIRVGCRRRDLEGTFFITDGLHSGYQLTLGYKRCPLILIVADFQPARPDSFLDENDTLISLSLPYLGYRGQAPSPGSDKTGRTDWLREHRRVIGSLQPGCSRGELMQHFRSTGQDAPEKGWFVYRREPLIRILATFACGTDSAGRPVRRKEDVVTALSRPRLSSAPIPEPAEIGDSEWEAWLQACLDELAHFKKGCTRGELTQSWRVDRDSSLYYGHYRFRRCPVITLSVLFMPKAVGNVPERYLDIDDVAYEFSRFYLKLDGLEADEKLDPPILRFQRLLEPIASVRPGMTREQLAPLFHPSGSSARPEKQIFSLRKNAHIRIEVTFDCRANEQGQTVASPQDKILHVTPPFLSPDAVLNGVVR